MQDSLAEFKFKDGVEAQRQQLEKTVFTQ